MHVACILEDIHAFLENSWPPVSTSSLSTPYHVRHRLQKIVSFRDRISRSLEVRQRMQVKSAMEIPTGIDFPSIQSQRSRRSPPSARVIL